ncbi:MAG: acetyl-CoA carboxylase biotin carboxylase subunit [Alphaproteobacteria bacterium GM7ARS4]|nr:acetyl-CoA carboxylase biotin carboxylase subunit [Alphaproteobacteria bacterium GM7ARS4]
MFEKILIANRGETALRIHRACREMGIHTVAVHSEADANAMHVRLADESVCIGPAPAHKSYLNIPAIISAAIVTHADAIHPGIGFLAENADFAHMVQEHGLVFIGPQPDHIQLMGDKAQARQAAIDAGLAVIPGTGILPTDPSQCQQLAQNIGYPVIIKASGGGGGKGMKIAHNAKDLTELLPLARREAEKFFKNPDLYIEKYLKPTRHIEVQILCDTLGHVVHLGERDCSIQRQHQKIIEEAPSQALNSTTRQHICAAATQLAEKIGYVSLGTVEFLYSNDTFYFIEMNTRLQVEHTITEMITGIDLVREQILIAAGKPFAKKQEDITFQGHAIECRINAEDPETMTPFPGTIQDYHAPGGLDVRVDSALYAGYTMPPWYDSLIAKLIVHGKTRNECLMRLRRALEEFVIHGIKSTIPLHQKLTTERDFLNGTYHTDWLEHKLQTPHYLSSASSPVSRSPQPVPPVLRDKSQPTMTKNAQGQHAGHVNEKGMTKKRA